MIAEDMLTQAQQRCIPDVSFELIPIRNLVSNQEYQRPLSENHIRKALEEFDVYQINPVKATASTMCLTASTPSRSLPVSPVPVIPRCGV